jgi:hypothetical protein
VIKLRRSAIIVKNGPKKKNKVTLGEPSDRIKQNDTVINIDVVEGHHDNASSAGESLDVVGPRKRSVLTASFFLNKDPRGSVPRMPVRD